MKRRIYVLLIMLISVKLSLAGLFFYQALPTSMGAKSEAIASEPLGMPPAAPPVTAHPMVVSATELTLLAEQQAELERKAAMLAEKKAELEKIAASLDEKIATLTRLRNEIRSENEQKEQVRDQKLKHLIKVYSAMKPQNAATLIEKMDTQLAIQLFSTMKGEAAGSILSFIAVDKAARISEGLLERP